MIERASSIVERVAKSIGVEYGIGVRVEVNAYERGTDVVRIVVVPPPDESDGFVRNMFVWELLAEKPEDSNWIFAGEKSEEEVDVLIDLVIDRSPPGVASACEVLGVDPEVPPTVATGTGDVTRETAEIEVVAFGSAAEWLDLLQALDADFDGAADAFAIDDDRVEMRLRVRLDRKLKVVDAVFVGSEE